ncbi:MAG: ABC transporter permease [Paracoccaceae bacterium]|jgi:simple sugar transport system permease protein|nr:ABC transporter permease [Paracoccaceae bacterium]
MQKIPQWADVVLVPLISLLLATIISALVILAIGQDPVEAVKLMVIGALGSTYGWGYTLYYATNFIFTGLAVSVAFHAKLFNIGGEGQAMIGGLGVAIAALYIPWPHWSIALLACTCSAAVFGALWGYLPAILQAKRGSHIVITTIMLNFIAAGLLNYILVNVLRPPKSMDPATATFPPATHLPTLHDILLPLGMNFSRTAPANITLLIALLAAVFVWLLIWRTRLGYSIRSFGQSGSAAQYAGINPVKITVITMLISGGLAGMMSINTTMGEAERLILNAPEGAGFIGIAVALMGRSHPLGVVLASLLFGFLYQGGAELAMWMAIPRELIVVIQALVILFTGALDNMVRMPIEAFFSALRKSGDAK